MRRTVVAVLVVSLLLTLAGCAQQPKTPEEAARAAVIKAFGVAKDDNAVKGATDFKFENGQVTVAWRFFPPGLYPLVQEIGTILAPSIRQFYQLWPDADKLTVYIVLPYDDNRGNRTWKPSFMLSFDRAVYQSINWQNFEMSQLTSVARDFRAIK